MSEERDNRIIFISLTHSDSAIADALKEAVSELFGNLVVTRYSTSQDTEVGISPGDDWFLWIKKRVKEADSACILLTPASVQKPWILWEAGAVKGVALSDESEAGDSGKVRPFVFQLKTDEIPSPFQRDQITRGDERGDIEQFFLTLIKKDFHEFLVNQNFDLVGAGKKLDNIVDKYLKRVEIALLNAPLLPTESIVQEWCLRLDKLKTQHRASEVKHLHDWINVAFGRGEEGMPMAIDFRIHRRLGDLYMGAQNYEKAAEQFELAKKMVPRDLMILRRLGEAYLKKGDMDKAKSNIDRIEELDPVANTHNVECAALKGKWYRLKGDLSTAQNIFQKARLNNPKSYYIIDLLAQVTLAKNEIEQAKIIYGDLLRTLKELAESNMWLHASAATAAIVIGDKKQADENLKKIKDFKPSNDNIASIEGGLEMVRKALMLGEEEFKKWSEILREKE